MPNTGNYQSLVEFINQCPIALIKADKKGEIEFLNALATQMLIPLSLQNSVGLKNILDIVEQFDKTLTKKIKAFNADYGAICSNYRLKTIAVKENKHQYLTVTVTKINETNYQYSFVDVTENVEIEKKVNALTHEKALQTGKLEMSIGILHDIGNAVTAFGSEVVKIKNNEVWEEQSELIKFKTLLTKREAHLDDAFGSGKGVSIIKFINALVHKVDERRKLIDATTKKLYNTTSHIQEILNIQRHYAIGKTEGKRQAVSIQAIIDDALAIQTRGLEKKGITLTKKIQIRKLKIEGDKTKLVQVLINLLKNASESFDKAESKEDKQIELVLEQLDNGDAELKISDNGAGFSDDVGKTLFTKGTTYRPNGTGFGLHNCMQIIKSHNGNITINSQGKDKGATVTIIIPTLKVNLDEK